MDISNFDPTAAEFRADPYPFYAAFREKAPVFKVGAPYNNHWVFSHELVKKVCNEVDVFRKPGKDRDPVPRPFGATSNFPDGLFFMDPPRHTQVRALMDDVFARAIVGAKADAQKQADDLLKFLAGAGTMKLVKDFSSRLPTQVFMGVMGIPPNATERRVLDGWTRASLRGHEKKATPDAQLQQLQFAGATANMAARCYLLALSEERPPEDTPWGPPSIMAGMQALTTCPATPTSMDPYEVMNTAGHFALGGYLSTEFLITTGIYNLLRHPDQKAKLEANPSLLEKAVYEMLRYDAPFQMADRWVAKAYKLGDVELKEGERITVVYGSANRDGKVFPDPDRFDIERDSTANNFGFGHSIHRCIGKQLAIEVTASAVEVLLRRFPKVGIVDKNPAWLPDPYFRSLEELTLRLQ